VNADQVACDHRPADVLLGVTSLSTAYLIEVGALVVMD
jgi:hypothetical protein